MKTHLILPLFLSMLCISALGAEAATATGAGAPAKGIVISADKLDRMSVTFNHSTHSAVACDTCHHAPRCVICHRGSAAADDAASCSQAGCHTPQGKSSDPKSRFMAFHSQDASRSCMGCHLKEAEKHPDLSGCSPCHTPTSVAPR
ncbi:MAG: cytochrome c3 family protein [Mailhella sp.]|nr:cytochrome c3 family protein [Mailhella sp.]